MAERYDFDAVAADDALLDLLAAGGDSLVELRDGGDDPAIQLLAELRLAVEEIDDRPAVLIDAETFLAKVAARNAGSTDPLARKIATRSLALSVAAVAALSVSGVAAAVGGDPLAPYEKVIERVVDVVSPQTSFPVDKINGLVIGNKGKMAKAEKEWVAGHTFTESGLNGSTDDETITAADEYYRSLGLNQRTVARPKPPFVLPTEPKPSAVKPSDVPGNPVATDDKTDNGKSEDKGKSDDKPVDQATTPPPASPTEDPTQTVTPPPTSDPTPTEDSTQPTEDPTATPSEAGNGQQGQQTEHGTDNESAQQGNGSAGENDGKGNDDQSAGTGELQGSASSTPSSQPSSDSQPSDQTGSETSIEPSAQLPAASGETAETPKTDAPAATDQVDPATVVQQSLADAISANAAAKRNGKHHHSVRPADVRKGGAHARHARREHSDGRKVPDIADTRLLSAVTSEALGTVAVLGR